MDIEEGGLTVSVPEARDGASEGTGGGVFFNPTQELNRDVTVATLRAYRDREPRAASYLDAMAASGVRGVRAAAEEYDVTCADVDADAVELAAANLDANGLDGEAVHRDVNALLYDEGPFDVVDLDPYGTPIPFADAAFANGRNLVCVTATDTAPLCGAHLNSGIRKYGAVPRNTDYHPEMGLRTLLSALVRTAARYDKAATPILSHVSRHYARTYLELESGARTADDCLEAVGHVDQCEDCLWREATPGHIADPVEACPECGSDRVLTAGPIWLGPVADADFARAVRREVTDEMGEAKRARKLLGTVAREIDTPTHYDQHRLYKEWGEPAIGMDEFVERLRGAGHEASRAHYRGTAVKSTASIPEMREAVLGDGAD
ncbi:N(2),N(2)-dimethylguanosine tRNA methyltransferase [Halorubrum californiense DSM 19288]|uniref:tRNA (guanine(26)-N(2))-dimethyltransferase n=1 Tax=Halorubrum californiense DSM 19288 TaxID=1227465 RepID=M0EK47_9EURY|nr:MULTISPECIES: tRNA (guanine(26)-N(2))-dimethyltransferase [Halorubrum]ELZ46799.1 N(2),N(2)-dimethylguanosine tRNA methyltransferase [Halorubrum californiense DSM 19288]TKX69944.1 tRNA (guanine(26)-N(2))-dimethyltransferase [Halorubrum sp. GN11GM_10-3_MGM]